MNFEKIKTIWTKIRKPALTALIIVASIISILIISCGLYLNDQYETDKAAVNAYLGDKPLPKQYSDGSLRIIPENATSAIIFYPGGKVQYTSYIPLMQALADRGMMSVLVKMPFNLAVLDVNAADGIMEEYPNIDNWYIGGHSLGGSMAASYLSDNATGFDGLVLLGAYSTTDISALEVDVLSIFGSEDGVMNRTKYEECKSNLPESFEELVIEGGSHAYFGMYGEQDGDGAAKITRDEQISITADAIFALTEK